MTTQLNQVRFHTPNDVYHYTTDNRPLQDLDNNVKILRDVFDGFSSGYTSASIEGDWASSSFNVDLTTERGKQFTYKVKLWAVEDSTVINSSARISMQNFLVTGVNSLTGVVTLIGTPVSITSDNLEVGSGRNLEVIFAVSANRLSVSFSGFISATGRAVLHVEKFS